MRRRIYLQMRSWEEALDFAAKVLPKILLVIARL